jgi:hypothetical protein
VEKLLYLMGRKDGLTRAEFGSHYLQVHSLLGARLCVLMAGYTVNLTDEVDPGPGGPDSITEVWTPDAEAFMDPARAFRNEEEMMQVVSDDQSFIGTHLSWVVEEKLLLGDRPGGELRTRTPGAKRVSLHSRYSGPPASRGVTRVVEQRVRKVLSPEAPAVEVFLCEWAPGVDAFAPVDGPAWIVSEYRQLDPTLSATGRRT